MAKLDFSFLEVGVSYGNLEFYQAFAFPKNLLMRRYCNGSIVRVSVEDWLQSDFITSLALRLHLIHVPQLKLVSISSFRPFSAAPVPINNASSLPDSWIMPFIHCIAQEFLNTYYHESTI